VKIEAGCLARIVNSKAGNNGIVVEVGNFIGDVNGWTHGSRWEISKSIISSWGDYSNTCAERCLQRIDGNRKTVSWSACEFQPKNIKVTYER